jgi:hypothetical protein
MTIHRALLPRAAYIGFLLLFAAGAVEAGPTDIRPGMPYKQARAKLIKTGWVPIRAKGGGCEPGREDVCRAYPETVSCAGTANAMCTFGFRALSGDVIEVVTHGARVGDLRVSEIVECRPTGCD